MSKSRIIIIVAVLAAGLGTPVMANPAVHHTGTEIPEPSDFALFLMGVAGLVIGRRSARRRHHGDNDTKT